MPIPTYFDRINFLWKVNKRDARVKNLGGSSLFLLPSLDEQ